MWFHQCSLEEPAYETESSDCLYRKKEEDYQRAIDHYIHISLYQQINGQKVYEGTLTQLSDKEITLDYLDKTRHRQITIDRQKIAQARLAIKF